MMAQAKPMRQIRLASAVRIINTEAQFQAEERKNAKKSAQIRRMRQRQLFWQRHKKNLIERSVILSVITGACAISHWLTNNMPSHL